MWNAIKRFSDDVVSIYYKSDNDVRRDNELKDFIQDLHDNGFPSTDSEEHGRDVVSPSSLNSRDELIEWLTCVIFCSSALHAALNFPQFEYYAFNPNVPMLMRSPAPEAKGDVSDKHILNSLGSVDSACLQIAVTWLLASYSQTEVKILIDDLDKLKLRLGRFILETTRTATLQRKRQSKPSRSSRIILNKLKRKSMPEMKMSQFRMST